MSDVAELVRTGRKPCAAADFDWIVEQNPGLLRGAYRAVIEEAGAIVANDILDRVELHLFNNKAGTWEVHTMVDAYTDSPGEEVRPVALDILLRAITAGWEKDHVKGLADLLRAHADRLEAELAQLYPTASDLSASPEPLASPPK